MVPGFSAGGDITLTLAEDVLTVAGENSGQNIVKAETQVNECASMWCESASGASSYVDQQGGRKWVAQEETNAGD